MNEDITTKTDNELFEKYYTKDNINIFIYMSTHDYKFYGLSRAELTFRFELALIETIRKKDKIQYGERGFKYILKRNFKHQCCTGMGIMTAKKRIPKNMEVSTEAMVGEAENNYNDNKSLDLPDESDFSYEDVEFMDWLKSKLTKKELKITKLLMEGQTKRDIKKTAHVGSIAINKTIEHLKNIIGEREYE